MTGFEILAIAVGALFFALATTIKKIKKLKVKLKLSIVKLFTLEFEAEDKSK